MLGKEVSTMAGVKHWNRLPRKAMESPSSEMFSTQQYMVQSNLTDGDSAPDVLSNLNYPMIPSNVDLMSEAGFSLITGCLPAERWHVFLLEIMFFFLFILLQKASKWHLLFRQNPI